MIERITHKEYQRLKRKERETNRSEYILFSVFSKRFRAQKEDRNDIPRFIAEEMRREKLQKESQLPLDTERANKDN